MAFTKVAPTVDTPYHVYHLIKPGKVDAPKLLSELEAALGKQLSGVNQVGHLVTGEIAYIGQSIVQLRLKADTPELTPAEEAAAETVILSHQAG